MKTFLQVLLLGLLFQSVAGQDKIITTDNHLINVKIFEQTNKFVKYKMNDYAEGPVIWLSRNRISKIEYQNGVVDLNGNQNPRKARPFGINAGIAFRLSEEGGMISTTADYFVIPQVDLELNVGTDFVGSYFSAGTRLHLNSSISDNLFTPFSGLLIGTDYGLGFIQIPVGINYAARMGLNVSLSLNEMLYFQDWQATFAELRVGWRFKL
jgi:hypothetical protein